MDLEQRERVSALCDTLAAIFMAVQFPGDEDAYKALVEIAEWLRVKRNFAVHSPELQVNHAKTSIN